MVEVSVACDRSLGSSLGFVRGLELSRNLRAVERFVLACQLLFLAADKPHFPEDGIIERVFLAHVFVPVGRSNSCLHIVSAFLRANFNKNKTQPRRAGLQVSRRI